MAGLPKVFKVCKGTDFHVIGVRTILEGFFNNFIIIDDHGDQGTSTYFFIEKLAKTGWC